MTFDGRAHFAGILKELAAMTPEEPAATEGMRSRNARKAMCVTCSHVHDPSWTVAVNRFRPEVPTLYVAAYPLANVYGTRIQAEADMCAHKAQSGAT